jgi:hypothetical protein
VLGVDVCGHFHVHATWAWFFSLYTFTDFVYFCTSTVFRRPAHSISTSWLGNPPIKLTELTIDWEGAWFKPATVALLYSQVHYHWAPLASFESAEIMTGTSSCNMTMVQHMADRTWIYLKEFFFIVIWPFSLRKKHTLICTYIINIKNWDTEHWPLPPILTWKSMPWWST